VYGRIIHAQADQAVMMMQSLPPSVLHMIDQGHWPGDGCFVLESEITRPNANEVAQNYFLETTGDEQPEEGFVALVYMYCSRI
jgi:hypothetical protein